MPMGIYPVYRTSERSFHVAVILNLYLIPKKRPERLQQGAWSVWLPWTLGASQITRRGVWPPIPTWSFP
jgi:hypothetical protein